MNEEGLQQLLDSVGMIAELSVAHYNACVNAGASPDAAAKLTTGFIETTIRIIIMMRSLEENDEDED